MSCDTKKKATRFKVVCHTYFLIAFKHKDITITTFGNTLLQISQTACIKKPALAVTVCCECLVAKMDVLQYNV